MEDQNKRDTCFWSSKSQFIRLSPRGSKSSGLTSADGMRVSSGKVTLCFLRLQLEKLHSSAHWDQQYCQHLGEERVMTGQRRLQVWKASPWAQFLHLSSLLPTPAPQVTSQETAASLLSLCPSEIGTRISSGWLKLNPDKSTAMLIGSGKEFEEVTRTATSPTIKKAFPQSGLGGGYKANWCSGKCR